MIDVKQRIDDALRQALARSRDIDGPQRLTAAIEHAVFPGGARIRPQLCLAVAGACDAENSRLPLAAATAIELLHCASLVHDDLPCFDNAPLRRGKPSVQAAFGERLAVLTGDALIVLAFESLAATIVDTPRQSAEILGIVVRAVGTPFGLTAGQAWECEPTIALRDYHRAKTGALFAAATMAGAVAAGAHAESWRELGEGLGEAYQVADELHDVATRPDVPGKPAGQDSRQGRPSAVARLGIDGAAEKFQLLVRRAVDSIPPCPQAAGLRLLVTLEARRYLPRSVAREVA